MKGVYIALRILGLLCASLAMAFMCVVMWDIKLRHEVEELFDRNKELQNQLFKLEQETIDLGVYCDENNIYHKE